ncbi:MAG: sulfatase-like hydrolase/transferase [Bacillota bacterium]
MKPKNLIIITFDELRADSVGFMGNPDCKTPNLDAFAARGTVFENHFCVHGKCVPSRISLMTGRYSHTDGFRTIYQHLPETHPNVLSTLKEKGFETAVFGHNHVWENFFGNNEKSSGVVDYHSFTHDYFIDMLDEKIPVPGSDKPKIEMTEGLDYEGIISEDLVGFTDHHRTKQAIHYLQNVRDKSKPFFMQLNYEFPHPRYRVEEPYFSMYDRSAIKAWPHLVPESAPKYMRDMLEVRSGASPTQEQLREIQAVYYGMVTRTDALFGKLLKTIESQGLLENSVIIFTSDHGDFAGQYGLVEKWDTCMLDCIMRVPMILFAPESSLEKRIDNLTEHVDVAPTILELFGFNQDWGIHGRSLLGCVRASEREEVVFADGGHEAEMISRIVEDFSEKDLENGKQRMYFEHPEAMSRVKMVRTKNWKLVVRLDGENELYDLENDPSEMQNVFGDKKYQKITMDLQLKLIQWSLRTDTDRPYQEIVRA